MGEMSWERQVGVVTEEGEKNSKCKMQISKVKSLVFGNDDNLSFPLNYSWNEFEHFEFCTLNFEFFLFPFPVIHYKFLSFFM